MASLEELRRKLRQRLAEQQGTFLPGQATPAAVPPSTDTAPPPAIEQGFLSPLPQSGPPAESDSFLPPTRPRLTAVPRPTPSDPREFQTPRGPAGRHQAFAIDYCEWADQVATRLSYSWSVRSPVLAECRLERVLFLDLETCGLGDCPLFLIGLACWGKGTLRLELLLAREPAEEAAVIAAAAARLAECEALVTFNGATFDLPFLHQRARCQQVELPALAAHLDLYPVAKQRFGKRYGDCRLQTLERAVCRRQRSTAEIQSARIPAVYERYCQEGDFALMRPILYHNAIDLITLADLLPQVAGGEPMR